MMKRLAISLAMVTLTLAPAGAQTSTAQLTRENGTWSIASSRVVPLISTPAR